MQVVDEDGRDIGGEVRRRHGVLGGIPVFRVGVDC